MLVKQFYIFFALKTKSVFGNYISVFIPILSMPFRYYRFVVDYIGINDFLGYVANIIHPSNFTSIDSHTTLLAYTTLIKSYLNIVFTLLPYVASALGDSTFLYRGILL